MLEQPLQESLDERALANPRAAVNEHGHRLALAHVLERRTQAGKLGLTAHEQLALSGQPRRFSRHSPQPWQDLRPRGTLDGISLQQIHAQPVQFWGDVLEQRCGTRRV